MKRTRLLNRWLCRLSLLFTQCAAVCRTIRLAL